MSLWLCVRTGGTPRQLLRQCFKKIEQSSCFKTSLKKPLIPETTEQVSKSPRLEFKDLWKPLGFSIGFTCCAFTGASIVEYERARKQNLRSEHFSLPWSTQPKAYSWRTELNKWWNSLRPAQQTFFGIFFLNTCVFTLWNIRTLRPMMFRNFASHLHKEGSIRSMILSVFSHSNALHLGLNMYVLYSFTVPLSFVQKGEHFAAFYLSAGIWSSFLSQVVRVLRKSTRSSIGASGAICGVIAATCLLYPTSEIGIVFLPGISFTAEKALYGLMAFDTLGILLKWRLLDHAGHLGGTLFGIWYTLYGHKYLWDRRGYCLRKWHEFRSKK